MNVNEKGNIGLIEVIRDLSRKGYECFTPFHDYSAVDLIAMNSKHEVKRLQIKYREFIEDLVDIPLSSVVNGKKVPIDLSAVDGYAVYIPSVDSVCYISKYMIPEEFKGFRIRKTPRKNKVNIDKYQVPLYNTLLNEEVIWWDGREA